MKKILFLLALAICSSSLLAQKPKADDVLGKWFTENNEAKVEIYKTGNKYFGKFIWLKNPIDKETNKPKLDKHNPEDKLKSRPLLGLVLVSGFEFDGDDKWEKGSIYDPKSGKTYNCYLNLEGKDKLKVRGFIGKSWMGLGKTTNWTRTN